MRHESYEGIVAAKWVVRDPNGYRSDGRSTTPSQGVFGAACWASSVLAALESRATSGRGQHVETSLVQSTFVYSYDACAIPTRCERSSAGAGRDPHNDAPGYRSPSAQMGAGSNRAAFGPGS